MSIRKLLLEFVLVLAMITCLVIVVDSLRIRSDAAESVVKLQKQYLNATYEIYKDEIIGNLLIGDQNVERVLLKEIAEHRGVGLKLAYKNFNIQTGNFSTHRPAQVYELDLGNHNKAVLTLYTLNDLTNSLSFSDLGISLFLEFFVLSFGFVYLLWRFNKKLLAPLADLVSHFKPGQIDSYISPAAAVYEVKELAENMKLLREAVHKKAIHEAEVNAVKQVAHDIQGNLIKN